MQLALVEHGVKVAALDLAEGGAAGGAGLQAAQGGSASHPAQYLPLYLGLWGGVGVSEH